MFSNKRQLGLPKHYSFDIHVYSIRIPPTEGYQGQHFDFSKGVPSKTHKKWRLMELIRLPSVHRIFFRASVYEASPGVRFARATGRHITTEDFITYWYGGKLESDLSYINLALHTYIVQIRIHCAYQKIKVFSLIPNFSLHLASMAV